MSELFTNISGPIVMGWFLFPFHMLVYSMTLIAVGMMGAKVMQL